uniref:UBC core domain-containing protein n=1 Tax=Chromera velia CCMP2878 TaxID=1169474 RepID=A0A0G4HDX4_9ALVE|eukprot:Cvel_6424.t1-p1 / transcript=Cvel_6424.t1 / gene=Cvel_6424 / organism=Chromera_velia_CCMP2878 / gene_product=Ubiquitin-conjugating enzyme E2 J1, putative / transcript_product=Ubiquitin-conjugating enzyme E2 J1, putative / location=Cvel_scaffold314:55904-57468(+) / protein_length=368 / sequence_SO=supercontig / SO=protein_coding / is_pseudo=false
MREHQEILKTKDKSWHAEPIDMNDPYEWHYTIQGPEDSEFEGGVYHGRIVLPQNYPYAPPGVMILTPNGRFETGKKICLSASDYHPELWQPAWGIRTILEALRAFFPTPADGALRSLEYPPEVRQKLAKESSQWMCEVCGRTNGAINAEFCKAREKKTKADEPGSSKGGTTTTETTGALQVPPTVPPAPASPTAPKDEIVKPAGVTPMVAQSPSPAARDKAEQEEGTRRRWVAPEPQLSVPSLAVSGAKETGWGGEKKVQAETKAEKKEEVKGSEKEGKNTTKTEDAQKKEKEKEEKEAERLEEIRKRRAPPPSVQPGSLADILLVLIKRPPQSPLEFLGLAIDVAIVFCAGAVALLLCDLAVHPPFL